MIESKEKKTQTVKKGTFDLIKGEFSPAEASEIVNDLFLKKINFHEVKSFSQLIRFDSNDPDTLQRISELKLSQRHAQELIAKARKAGQSLRINSTVIIELI
jgi:hypothetical protein